MTKTATKQAIEKVLADDEPEAPTTDAAVLYDSRASQIIPLTLEKNGRSFRVTHTLNALSDERYFQLEEQFEQTIKRAKKISTAIYDPKHNLWRDLVTELGNYKPRDDWKEETDQSEAVAAVNALLHVEILGNDEFEGDSKSVYYDPDELTEIQFRVMQSGTLMTLSHSFRQDTKAERDEFLSIEGDQPNENKLASAQKLTKAEKLSDLGRRLLRASDGYAGDIPAWHLAATVESFFSRQIGKMGKSLQP